MESGASSRGYELVVAHCEALETPDAERMSGHERLTESIGARLARMLVSALSGDHGMHSRRDRR